MGYFLVFYLITLFHMKQLPKKKRENKSLNAVHFLILHKICSVLKANAIDLKSMSIWTYQRDALAQQSQQSFKIVFDKDIDTKNFLGFINQLEKEFNNSKWLKLKHFGATEKYVDILLCDGTVFCVENHPPIYAMLKKLKKADDHYAATPRRVIMRMLQ